MSAREIALHLRIGFLQVLLSNLSSLRNGPSKGKIHSTLQSLLLSHPFIFFITDI